MGIVNEENYQIVFSDTPGVLKPVYKLQESMRKFSESALVDADIMLYITDIFETPDKNEDFLLKVSKSKAPVLLIINKIDLTDQDKLTQIVETWEQRLPKAEIIPCSALTKLMYLIFLNEL
jgi:GTP-binding protein Era